MTEMTFRRVGEDCELTIEEGHNQVTLTLNRDGIRALLMGLGSFVGELSEDPDLPLTEKPPLFDIVEPSFQIAADKAGRSVLVVQARPIGPIRIHFLDRQAREIAKLFLEIADTPMDMRVPKHLS